MIQNVSSRIKVLLAAFFIVGVTAGAASADVAASNVGATRMVAAIVEETNKSRSQHGLAPLTAHYLLDDAAAGHSSEMLNTGYFSHTSPTPGRRSPRERIMAQGLAPQSTGENLYYSKGMAAQSLAKRCVESWLNSPGHRRNLLDPNFTHVGIGVAERNGQIYVTQVFGGGGMRTASR